jgi:hypothetical protein
MKFASALIPAFLAFTSTAAVAGPALDAATRAEALLAERKYAEALAAADEARQAVWDASPLIIQRAVFVASDPQGFGIFDMRESNAFKRSEPLIIYAEPLGFGYGKDGDLYVIDLGLDFVIKGADGSVVASQENFGSLNMRSRVANKEFMAKLNYDFSGLPAGAYTVTTVLKDKNSAKTGEFTMDFTLTE